jgi:flavin-binding protein dodecin
MRVPASLTSLNLTGSSPSEIDVEAIGSEMPHLEELDVTQSSSFDDALVEAFCRRHDRRRSRLRVFKVTDTGVTVDGVKVRRRVLRCR